MTFCTMVNSFAAVASVKLQMTWGIIRRDLVQAKIIPCSRGKEQLIWCKFTRSMQLASGYFKTGLIVMDSIFIAGERPYKCHVPDCGRAFIQLSNLQQHLRNHESQLERLKNRPFHCAICGKGFATESSMRTHNSKVWYRDLQINLNRILEWHWGTSFIGSL